MFDFGDDLTIDGGYKIPWIIWIQILVLFLLIFLLYCFSVFTSDLSDSSTAATSSASPSTSGLSVYVNPHLETPVLKHNNGNNSTTVRSSLQHNQVVDRIGNRRIKGEIASSTGRRTAREANSGREGSAERDGSWSKDANNIDYHPCTYFRLAKLAFLKCLGLDSTAENSSNSERRKER